MKEQTEVGKLKEGKYLLVDDEPCKILSISISKPGKHGAAKARLDVMGIFDGVKRSIVQPVSAKVYAPIVERRNAQVISKAGNVIQMMDLEDFSNFECTVSEDVSSTIEAGKETMYIFSMGKRKIDFA